MNVNNNVMDFIKNMLKPFTHSNDLTLLLPSTIATEDTKCVFFAMCLLEKTHGLDLDNAYALEFEPYYGQLYHH